MPKPEGIPENLVYQRRASYRTLLEQVTPQSFIILPGPFLHSSWSGPAVAEQIFAFASHLPRARVWPSFKCQLNPTIQVRNDPCRVVPL